MVDHPAEDGGREVERGAGLEALGDLHGLVTRGGEHVACGQGKARGQVSDEVEPDHEGHEPHEERLDDIAPGDRKNAREKVEHAGKGRQGQELVPGKDNGEQNRHRDEQDGDDERRRMADDKRRAHADAEAQAVEPPGELLARTVGDRLEALDEQARDTRDELHDGADLDAQTEDFRQVVEQTGTKRGEMGPGEGSEVRSRPGRLDLVERRRGEESDDHADENAEE